MSKHFTVLIFLFLFVGLTLQSYSEGDTVNIILEAEEFNGQSPDGWHKSEMGYCWGAPHAWSKAKLTADAGDKYCEVKKEFEVPQDGNYRLLVRYEAVADFNSVFGVKIMQDRSAVTDKTFGRTGDLKYIPAFTYGRGYDSHNIKWYWHSGDLVVQETLVSLKKGKATAVIYKGENEKKSAKRFIDFLWITDDFNFNILRDGGSWTENIAGKTYHTNRVFLRITIPSDAKEPFLLRCTTIWPHQPPFYYYGQGIYTKEGHKPIGMYHAVPKELFLNSGESSVFSKVWLRTTGDNRVNFWTEPKKINMKGVKFEFSSDPEGKNILRTITVPRDSTEFCVLFTRDVKTGEHIKTMEEIDMMRREWISNANPIGKLPNKFPITFHYWQIPDESILRSMGATFIQSGSPREKSEMDKYGFIGYKYDHYVGYYKIPDDTAYAKYEQEKLKEKQKFEEMGTAKGYPKIYKLIDEPGMWGLSYMRTNDYFNKAFSAYLKERNLDPYKFLNASSITKLRKKIEDNEQITKDSVYGITEVGTEEDAVWNPELYYHSQIFRSKEFTKYYRGCVQVIEKVFGDEIFGVPVNLSPGRFIGLQGWHDGIDYVDFYREGGSTMMLSESWHDNVPGLVGEIDAFMMDLFACARKYNPKYKMGQYAISDSNRAISATSVKVKSASIIGHGADFIEYYCGEGAYPGSTTGPILYQKDNLQAVTQYNYALGDVEDILLSSKRPKAETALLWHRTTQIWDTSKIRKNDEDEWYNSYMYEIMFVYLALRQAGIDVEIITEDDIAEGYLKNFKVLYLTCDQIQSNSAEGIKQWVNDGGVLFSVAGGGLKDEYNRGLATLNDVYGIKSNDLKKVFDTMNCKLELPRLKSVDLIGQLNMNAYNYRQAFAVTTASVLGTFADASPAYLKNNYGKGKATIIGTLPGINFAKPAFPLGIFSRSLEEDDLMDFRATNYEESIREFIVAPARTAGVKINVFAKPAYVEGILWENEKYYLIPLINYSGVKINNAKIFVSNTLKYKNAKSQQLQKSLQKTVDEKSGTDSYTMYSIPLDCFDFLILEK